MRSWIVDSPPGVFTRRRIQAYIEECEQKSLNLDNEEIRITSWIASKAKDLDNVKGLFTRHKNN